MVAETPLDADLASLKLPPAIIDVIGVIGNLRVRFEAKHEGNAERPRMSHSLGHGVGLDVHEAPSLRDLDYPLLAGDVVTIEPGLYLKGVGGVRVEDTGIITADGFQNFTTLPKSLDPKAYL